MTTARVGVSGRCTRVAVRVMFDGEEDDEFLKDGPTVSVTFEGSPKGGRGVLMSPRCLES